MPSPIAERLKALKHERAGGSPDAQWLASAKETILMQIGNTVGAERRTGFRASAASLRLFFPANLGKALAIPLAALLLAVGAGFGSSAAVAAAHDTLPGHFLYNVKLAAEAVSLRMTGKAERTERRIEIAGRRLDEMARLAAGADPRKEEKIERVAARFSVEMDTIRKELDDLKASDDAAAALRIAMKVDARADEYRTIFEYGLFIGRPSFRMALLDLDQASLKALEILVEKQSLASDVLPEAQLTSAVGRKIDAYAAHVAVSQDNLDAGVASPSLLLTAKAKEAVEEAKQLFSLGDFRTAVRKVSESAEFVAEAENADRNPPSPVIPAEAGTQAASGTGETATSTESATGQP